MAGRTDGLIKNFRAIVAIPARSYVIFGATDVEVTLATGPADSVIGVTTELDASAGERVDVILGGIADVRFGANVGRGDLLTTDVMSRAVTAAPGAGVVNRLGGMSLTTAVAGDVGPALIFQGQIKG